MKNLSKLENEGWIKLCSFGRDSIILSKDNERKLFEIKGDREVFTFNIKPLAKEAKI